MLRFSTPAVRRGVQSDCERRSMIATRNAPGRATQHRRDWRAGSWTCTPTLNLARKENDQRRPRAPFFTLPLCIQPCISTSAFPTRTIRVDHTHLPHSVRSNVSSTSSSATLRAGAPLSLVGPYHRVENVAAVLGPMRSLSTISEQTRSSDMSSDSFDSTSGKRQRLSISLHPARRCSNGHFSSSGRRDAGATPCNASAVSRVCSAAPRPWSSGARSGPSSSPSHAFPEISQ